MILGEPPLEVVGHNSSRGRPVMEQDTTRNVNDVSSDISPGGLAQTMRSCR
jgi:hypothetical protein